MLTPDQIKAMQQGAPSNLYGGSASIGGHNSLTDLTAPYQAPAPKAPSHPVGDFVKGMVSAPTTMVARPFQAVAELAGAPSSVVDKVSSDISGGLIAPTPQSASDVGKDVGRGLQTAAFGLNPVAGGAAFMGGSALEQGKDAFHVALDTALGAAGGKVLGLVGAPLFNVAGKVVGKITPQFIQDLAGKGTKAIQDFAAQHEILPEFASGAINKGAGVVNNMAEAPFNAAGDTISSTVGGIKDSLGGKISASREGRIVQGRIDDLTKLENNNASLRKAVTQATAKGIDVKDIVANTDLLQGAVDKTGTIRTTQPGGAIEKLTDFIQPQEDVISQTLKREGKIIPLSNVEQQLTEAINASSLKGGAKTRAIANAKADIEGYKLDAVDAEGNPWIEGESKGEPQLPVATVHDAKVDKYSNIDYTNPESKKADKIIAKTLKQIVENNTESADAKALNEELARHYQVLGFLEKMDGKKIEGGKLGKYFSKTIGAVAGAHFGPLGSILGAEGAGAIHGAMNVAKFGPSIGKSLESSDAMKTAIGANQSAETPLQTTQMMNGMSSKNGIPPTIPQESNLATPIAKDPGTIAEEHITSSQQILDNLPLKEIQSLGGISGLLERTKINIVDGLKAEGFTKEASLLKGIDPSHFTSLNDFDAAMRKIFDVYKPLK